VLWRGRLLQTATPEALYRQPVSRELASFVGEAVLLPGDARRGRVTCALGELPLVGTVVDGAVDVMVRPEQIHLRRPDDASPIDAGTANATWLDATVQDVTFHGQDAAVVLDVPSPSGQTTVRSRVPGYRSPRPGERVRLTVDGEVTAYARG
jgi:iron(III) transport system ATP-binding protein